MTAEQVLQTYFGYNTFRKGQKEAIDGILSGKDVLGIMPTGSGKSICFQVPALLFSGVTLVVSPLISLMQDQVTSLRADGIGAAFINSSQTQTQIHSILEHGKNGDYRLLYLAPERLLSLDFLEFAKSIPISMVVVDEAHCISGWGQDFRPSYGKIPEFIKQLPKRPIVSAFTATATGQVQKDIISMLEMEEPLLFSTGYNRENLYFSVQHSKDKSEDLLAFLTKHQNESGIVYCATRAAVEEVCQKLLDQKIFATKYHAGLSKEERNTNQIDFLYDIKEVMVATNAFGMGIDKSNVSFVVHYNLPKDMESYYQEAGRAGRDGSPAQCLLLHNEQDVALCKRMIAFGKGMHYETIELKHLLQERAYERLAEMELYAAGRHCLRHTILRYFGESSPLECGHCGECNTKYDLVDITVESQKIISCVARGREKLSKTAVIDVLRGVESPQVLAQQLYDMTTFGISKESSARLSAMINHLLWKGFLAQSNERLPTLQLTKKSVYVVKSMVYLDMKVPVYYPTTKIEAEVLVEDAPVAKKAETTLDSGELFEQLREVRKAYAKDADLPPFMIFSNATLLDMCEKSPKTAEEFLEVSGVGPVKLEKYGSGFLQVFGGQMPIEIKEKSKQISDTKKKQKKHKKKKKK